MCLGDLLTYYLLYFVAGASLKLGDDLLDEFDRPRQSWIPLTISGVTFGLLMTNSEWDLALFSSMILGVIVTRKVNRPQFLSGFVSIGLILYVVGVPSITNPWIWILTLFVVSISAAVDETGNDWFENKDRKCVRLFFQYRLSMKFAVLILGLVIPAFMPTAIGLWIFDLGYELVGQGARRHFT